MRKKWEEDPQYIKDTGGKITRLPVGGYQLDTFFLCPGSEFNVLITDIILYICN